MERLEKDERFAHVLKDPRFRRIPKSERKVKIDKRFKGIFDDEEFQTVYKMDKRGRKVAKTSKEDMKKFYDLSISEEDEGESENVKEVSGETENNEISVLKLEKSVKSTDSDTGDEISIKSGDKIDLKSAGKLTESESGSESDSEGEIDLARGVGNDESSDSDEYSSESDSESEGAEFEHNWGELDTDAAETNEMTRRIAVCNMDWDRIKASDIFVLCNSFKPADGIVESVKIYPSEYGKTRLKDEELSGPKELVEDKMSDGEENGADDIEGSKYHMEKLRKYQLNRLRYYYAVVECDSPLTAGKIYDECSGIEYESSAVRLDLRFVPDSMDFDDEPTSVATSMPQPDKYKPTLFTTTALQQAKVQLTWDETDPDRVAATRKAFDKKTADKIDLKAYLASDSEGSGRESGGEDGDSEDDDATVSKYRQLLLNIENEEEKKREKEIEMEITWTPGLKEVTQELVKKKRSGDAELTPWDQYLKKKKEKRAAKKRLREPRDGSDDDGYSDDELPDDDFFRQELGPEYAKKAKRVAEVGESTTVERGSNTSQAALDLLLMDSGDGKKHFNMKNEKRKWKNAEMDNFEFDAKDERFDEIYTSHLFNIDPSDPQFKMTKGMERLIEEKHKRRVDGDRMEPAVKKAKADGGGGEDRARNRKAELRSLVKSIKNRTKSIVKRKK